MTRPLESELLHFAAKPLREVHDAKQGGPESRRDKPNGLWVSVGTSWPEWCLSESFGVDRIKAVTRVVLVDDAQILWLASAGAIDEFTERYEDRDFSARHSYYSYRGAIDWPRVAEQYDGIVIAPYCYERRMSLSWYYGWDVASGCIWNARAIASLESVDLGILADLMEVES